MITTSFYLDKRLGNAVAGHPLKLVFNHKSTRALLSMDICVKAHQWDCKGQRVVAHPSKNDLNAMLDQRKVDANRVLYELAVSGELEGLSIWQVKSEVAKRLFTEPTTPKCKGLKFLPRFDAFVETKHGGTERIYLATRSRLEAYLGIEALQRLTFEQMDVAWLRDFDRWLAKTSPSRNARNIHFRNIRTLFNEALTDEKISRYPFRKFKLTPEPTRKRALSREHFARLMSLKLEPWEERYRDCFKLIFLLQGINVIDLCGLGETVDGRVEYKRAKTGRLYSIALLPEAIELIERYKGKRQLLDFLDTCSNYRSFYSRLSQALRHMGERIGIKGLSTYWARHSWATFAASLDIPKETIAAGLGHGGWTVTDIYIDFDQHKVDAANVKIVELAKSLGL